MRHPWTLKQIYLLAWEQQQAYYQIEKLSHIIGTAPILEMARAYGLRPRLWFLAISLFPVKMMKTEMAVS